MARSIPLVYVAGAYSAADRAGVEAHIARAVDVGVEVARLGAMPVIPHANTADPRFEAVQPYLFWLEGTSALLAACNAMILVPGWESSNGARREYAQAQDERKPIFHRASDLALWLVQRAGGPR